MRAPLLFPRFQRSAAQIVGDRPRLTRLLAQASRKAAHTGQGRLRELRDDLASLVALVRAWLAGEYRDVSASTLVAVVAAILYFVVPLDAIPDFIVGWGLLDDLAVVRYVMGLVRAELEQFEHWRMQADSQDVCEPEGGER